MEKPDKGTLQSLKDAIAHVDTHYVTTTKCLLHQFKNCGAVIPVPCCGHPCCCNLPERLRNYG